MYTTTFLDETLIPEEQLRDASLMNQCGVEKFGYILRLNSSEVNGARTTAYTRTFVLIHPIFSDCGDNLLRLRSKEEILSRSF